MGLIASDRWNWARIMGSRIAVFACDRIDEDDRAFPHPARLPYHTEPALKDRVSRGALAAFPTGEMLVTEGHVAGGS